MVYIDLNMVRAGVVTHPSKWRFGGYNEIQSPKRKCALIAYHKLAALTGFNNYEDFRKAHRQQVEDTLHKDKNRYQAEWSQSIAVGNKVFIEEIKGKFGVMAKGRKTLEQSGTLYLREPSGSYNAVFAPKIDDIQPENTYYWNIK